MNKRISASLSQKTIRLRKYVTPDSFTHGSSRQRVRWFKQGVKIGDVMDCNTFRAGKL